MQNNIKNKYNGGAAMMVVVIFFIFISLTILVGVVNPTVREFKIASDSFKSKQTYFLAESGVEDVLYRLRNNKQTNGTESLVLGDSEAVTTVTDISNGQKEITSLGDTNSLQRKVKLVIDTGVGVSFSYGVQSGAGGFVMNNGSRVVGSIYSNGNITGSGTITGSASSANSSALVADQSNGSGTPPIDITFGNTNGTQDFAQSFMVGNTGVLNKIQLYIKKVSTPSNITARIVSDLNGSPSGTTLTSATISTSTISTNYGWIDVPFSSHIQLSSSTTYWLILDVTTSSTKYYKIGANNNGYPNGVSKTGGFGGTWSNTTPSGSDGYFSVYLGGLTGLISGITIGTNSNDGAYANTINNSNVAGTIYCQTGSGNNKSCNTSRPDPVQIAMPISEQNILDWKDAAAEGGTYNGNYVLSSNATLGPKKITGNLVVSNGVTLTLTGTIWVQGSLTVSNNAIIKLASGYGSSEGLIVTDGTISISNNSTFQGSGTSGSYVMALSTSSSTSAVTLANNGGAVVLYASNGTINVANNATAKSLTGYYINLSNNAVITYDEGLTNSNFSSGPSGTWNVNSWQEVE
ncbi:MAG: hypothetical protein UR85_C0009G0012 [Candidatus Nomurabacteria bacterium GW2011_GWF2_35_66]|uniref:Uncharacterized protein n=1 Tax=Candidatus Nomurabacteria bacterium GW2011_GWE1_35_16 TaxID=1618761 RepID=A0A0G0BR20_9BACT|nr:MAG: hypothetical protein UR55_C0014G0012 [Candidatus Nomurabacteria bacterium GW2011_GWF1_34_20]KKP62105.1 MAG: hypothetical protein UR57_C0013G0030 [Candidatus Nomurabacteria bacterium GW2011_GWE2_34_25]KKP66071.1 MAG: hypothetical protein UR64_C0013G0030 [Candidatus Nomurabacteria bacterium GW2011_GWE1_35_16]KKP83023.1 MAG: hypothetical protein UR85_C0009G0012 [Candidatus Nomurabacteria bacterium GW2011_GWF2_35_66]HAE36980.1 hypothetical protein [Candidatus Nomurabacteria bacterium]